MPETVWNDGLRPIIWEPIQQDAGAQGDAGYSYQNTAIYTFGLLASVVVFQALFRTLAITGGRQNDDRTHFLGLPSTNFPCLKMLISSHRPSIGFLMGRGWWRLWQLNIRMRIVPLLCLALLFMWAILFQPGYAEHDMGLFWVVVGLGIGFASLIVAFHATREWPTITRGLLAFAVGACFVGLGHWAQLAATPWLQESEGCQTMSSFGLHWSFSASLESFALLFIESAKTMHVNSN